MSPKLSVVTVVKNSAETLEQAMRSVLDQKNDDVEYVVIDGGSTDGSVDIIEQHTHALDYWHSRPDQGISNAFNQGIEHASGDYVGLLNADDFYEPGILSKVQTAADEHPQIDVLHGSVRYHDSASEADYVEKPDISKIRKFMAVYHPTMFVKRTAYQSIGGYRDDYRLAMDSEWVHRAVSSGLTFLDIDCVVANMRLHGTSHKQLGRSLAEFRKSSISHFGNISEATYYYLRQLCLQTILKNNTVRNLRLRRRN